jgi:hypothetical protein
MAQRAVPRARKQKGFREVFLFFSERESPIKQDTSDRHKNRFLMTHSRLMTEIKWRAQYESRYLRTLL